MSIINRHFILILVLAIGLNGCSSLSRVPQIQQSRLKTLLPNLIIKDVILVGESHTSYDDHQTQLAVIKALHPYWPKMGIGIEYVQSPFQPVLNDYVAGKLTDKQMLKQTEWYKRWRYDFRLYRGIFHYAKANHLPLIALNAPVELTKKISKQGINGLSAKDRKLLPKEISASEAYRKRLYDIFKQHAHGNSKSINNFIDVQLAWDESMAANAHKAIESSKVNNIILLAGSGHVVRHAIPERLPYSTLIIVTSAKAYEDRKQVDYVLSSDKKVELPESGKIGILMRLDRNKVMVSEVLASHQAGLKINDQILSINGIEMKSLEDIKIALFDKAKDDVVQVSVRRDKKRILEKSIKLY